MAQLTWDGGGDGVNFGDAANWTGNVAPTAGDDLVFTGAGGAVNNNLPAGTIFNTIQISGSGYSLGGNAIQLNGGLTANNVTGANTVGLEITLLNAQAIVNANPGSTLTLSGAIHTGNLIGTSQIFGTTALNFDGAGSTNVTGAIDGGASLTKYGEGTVTLSGANTYQGITDVRQGVLRAQSNTALGSATTGDTQIQAGAALHVAGNIVVAENIAVREGGVGFGNGTDGSSLGALRSVGGVNTITGNLDLNGGNNLIGVDGGSTLIHTGVVASATSATNRLIKAGDGTLQLAGTQDNVYRGETRVLKGTLELNKTAGRNAIGGTLIIGDNIGGDNAATVRLLADNQIPQLDYFDVALNNVQLESSGVLDLNGFSDTIGQLLLRMGTTYSSDVLIGGGGTLTLGGNLQALQFQGSSGATPAATISGTGTLDLGTFFSGGAAGNGLGAFRRFQIQDTQNPNIATDLDISANITDGIGPNDDVSIMLTDGGTLRLSGNNSGWAGPLMVQGSNTIEVGSNNALGSGLFSPQNGSTVVKAVGGSWTLPTTISLDSNVTFLGDDSTPGAENLTFTGAVTLTGDRTILTMDPTQTVTFAGVIGEGIFANRILNKSGRGTLEFTAANTYSGSTTINDDGGTLTLRGNGSISNASGVTIGVGSTLRVDNNNGGNLDDRLNDAMTVTNNGGRLHFVGASGTNSSEYFGTINSGGSLASTFESENTSGGAFATVVTANAFGIGTDRTLNFVGTGVPLTATGQNRFSFVNNPGNLDDGMLNASRVTNLGAPAEFVTWDSSPEGTAVVAFPAAAYVTDINQAGPTSNVKLTTPGTYTLTSSKSINSLILGPGVTLAGPGATLTVNSSNFLFLGAGASAITVDNLNVNAGSIFVDTGHTVTISGNIFNGNVQKGGLGKLILTGDSQTGGAINVNEGVINVQRSTALGSPAGTTTVRANATLELEETTFGPIAMSVEPISVNGTGVVSGLLGIGTLRNIAGNNSIAGNVTINSPSVNTLGLYGGFGGSLQANQGAPLIDVATGTTLTITGDFAGGPELGKIGGGTLELAGVISRGTDRNNRIFEGTLLLNNEAGVQASRGRYFIGTDVVGAPDATLRLGQSDQIIDDRRVEVLGSGLFDLNGASEVIGEGNLILHIAPGNSGDVTIGGGTLYTNADIQIWGYGVGNPTGATISGGTLALTIPGVVAGLGARGWQVNDMANGPDLTVDSVIVDGTGLQSVGITKNGFGELVLGGTQANTYTGDTTVNDGTLVLDKGTGTGGVNALAGRVFIGNNDVSSGFAGSDVLRLNQPNQLPDWLALVDVRTTGRFDLDGNDETIGVADVQDALTMQAGSTVNVTGGTLTVNGNFNTNSANGAGLWTPIAPPRIVGGTLALGSTARTFNLQGDRSELPYELEISSDITGTGGFITNNTSTLLLTGDNSGLSGDVIRTNGNFAVGSDTAFGTGRALFTDGTHITTYGGKRTLANEFSFRDNTRFIGATALAGTSALGGGGNDLTFTGPVNLVAGNWTPNIPVAGQVEFAGGIGETLGGVFARKLGYGAMVISSAATFSGNLEIGEVAADSGSGFNRVNGGHVILREGGTLLNSSVLIGRNGVFEINNNGVLAPNRIADATIIDLAGGTLALVGKVGGTTGEVFGQLRLRNNDATSYVQALAPAGATTAWRFQSYGIETANEGANVEFSGRGTDLSDVGTNKIGFITVPALTNAILPTAVLEGAGGLDFLTIVNPTPLVTPADNFVTALTNGPNFATTLAGATATTNVKLAASEVVGGATAANALLLPTGGLTVSGGGSLNLNSGLAASAGVGNTISVSGLTMGTTEGRFIVNEGGDLTVSGAVTGGATSTLAKGGRGLLTLSGANAYTGVTRVTDGVLRGAHNNAFGTTAGGVNVAYGATVELAGGGLVFPAETVDIVGNGETSFGAVGLRTVAGGGVSTWLGTVNLRSNRTGIDTAAGSTLIIGDGANVGQVTNQGFNKIGEGTLRFAGTGANNYGQSSIVWQGTLELNKTAGVDAIPNVALTIGDHIGGANADKLVWLTSDQINNSLALTLLSSGQFSLGAFNETINGFTLTTGPTSSANIASTTGVLTTNGNLTVNAFAGGFATPATIAGNLAIGGGGTATVNDGSGINELIVSAVVTGGTALTKAGSGRMLLTNNNSAYSGAITVNGGELVVSHANALGTVGANTTVNSGFTLLFDGVSLAEPLNINGVGFGGQGAIRNINGNNNLTGGITLAGTATIGVNAGQTLDVIGVIGGGGNGVTKLLPGTLRYSGTTANTYTGTTSVFEGTLELNKGTGTGGVDAIAGVLTVGNDAGAQGVDVVRLMQPDQINNGVQVQITPAGLLNLNGLNETLAQAATTGLNFFVAMTTNPQITTGAGTLTLGTNLGIQVQFAGGLTANMTTATMRGVTITGNVSLAAGNHNLNVGDTGLNIRELHFDGPIGGAGGITIQNTGITYFNGANTFAGGTTMNVANGVIGIGGSSPLGTGTVTIGTNGNNTYSIFATDYTPGAPSTITLPNNITLNTVGGNNSTLNLRGDDNLVVTGAITNALNNNTIQGIFEAKATLNLAGTINLSNDATNRTLTINNNTFGGGVKNGIVGGTVTISGQVVNGGGSAASNLTKGGSGLLLLSNNTNSFAGLTTVAAGVLLVTADNALGANGNITTNHTQVNNGGTLALPAGINLPEWVRADNNGLGNFGAIRLLDTTPGLAQTGTIVGNVNFNATTFVGVDAGGANPDRLVFSGHLNSGGGQMNKVGDGEMEVAGPSDNGTTFTGGPSPWDDGIQVRAGSLLLNKTGALRVISGGTITIGDGGGGPNADKLILIGSGTDHLGGNLNLDIGASGQFAFAGSTTSEQINQLQVFRLMSSAGSVDTTGAGTLILSANVFASNAAVTTASSPVVTIAGNLNLNGGRNVNASDSYVLDPAEDMVISALISNGSINVNGDGGRTGTTAITNGGNSYAGGTTITAQVLDFNASFNNGLNTITGGRLNVRGAGVMGTGNVNVAAGGTLVLDNTGTNANRIADGATLTATGGRLELLGNSAGTTELVGNLTLSAGNNYATRPEVVINSTAGGVTELRAAAFTRNGQSLTNFIGVGDDLGSTTNSRIQITGGGSPFANNTVFTSGTVEGPAGFDLVTDADGNGAAAPYYFGRVTTYSTDINAGGVVRLSGVNSVLTANRTVDGLILENGATVSGPFTLQMQTNGQGLIVSRGGNNAITSTRLDFGGREPLFLVEGGELEVASNVTGTSTLRKEGAGNLILSGDNDQPGLQYTGQIQINAGTLTARHSDAFGTTAGDVNMHDRALLVLDGNLTFGNEILRIRGTGPNNDYTGALRVINGNVAWGTGTTAVNYDTNPTFIDVEAGRTLTLNATIGGGGALFKMGQGELVYSGTAQNGNTQAITVNDGTLRLAKTAGTAPIAVRGTLTLNDLSNFDGVGAATVIYDAAAIADQIGDVAINVNTNGTLDLAGKSDATTGTLTINGGVVQTGGGVLQANALTMTGGTLSTGAGAFNLNGNLTYNAGLATSGPATINGNLNLLAGNRTFTVNDGQLLNDLTVNAVMSNGRLVKAGNGGLLLTNSGNTFLPGVNEVQRLVVAGATAGTSTFTINFNGNVTANIVVNAADATTAGLIDAALEALPNVGPGGVNVTVSGAGQFDIEFTGHLAEQDVPNQVTTAIVVGPGTVTPSTPTGGVPGISHTAGILNVGDNAALGTARVQMGNAQIFASGGDRTLANNFTLNNNVTTIFGGRRDFGGTNDLTLTGGVTLHSTVGTGQVVNIDVNDPLTLVTMSGVISGGGNFIVPTKRGIGTLVWSGNNTFDVRDTITGANGGTGQTDGIQVQVGTLRLAHSNSLGSTNGTASVFVRNDFTLGAALEIDGSGGPVNLPATRNIVLFYPDNYNAWGLYNRAGSPTGVLRSTAGTNSFAGILDIRNIGDNDNQGRMFVGVDAGTLSLTGTIFGTRNNANSDIRNNREFLKVGAGTLELAGTGINFLTLNTAVLTGTLLLNKAPGVPALSGTLVVGDNIGAPNSDIVILNAAEQIPDGSAVLVTGSGQLQASAAQAVSLTNEVQQIQVGNAAPAGQFRLQFGASTTGDISFGATLASIQAALNGLASIGGVGGSVLVQGAGSGQNQAFTVTFLGSLAGANQPQIKIVAGTTPYSGATLAVTTIAQGGLAGRETFGTTTLRIAPQGAGNINLQPGSTLSLQGDVIVDNYGGLMGTATTGAAINVGTLELRQQSANGAVANRNFTVNADAPATDDLTITAVITDGTTGSSANLNKNGAANSRMVLAGSNPNTLTGFITVSNGNLVAQNGTAFGSTQTDEVQSYIINNVLGNASGTYTITTDQGTTAAIPFNASAEEVENALNTMYGSTRVRVVSSISGNTGIQYSIRWIVPGTTIGMPILGMTPALTSTLTTALSYANDVALDAVNGPAGVTNFLASWTGFVTVAGGDPLTWSFGTNSDDGSVVFVDTNNDGFFAPSERVVNNLGFHGAQTAVGNVTFPAVGNYRILIGVFQGGGGANMEARFFKGASVAFASQTIINPSAQPGIWSDDASVANQFTAKFYNSTPVGTEFDATISHALITLTSSLTNASTGTVTTHQDSNQVASTTVVAGAALELRGAGFSVANEGLTLNGTGIINGPVSHLFNNGSLTSVGTGALRNVSGSNSWLGTTVGFGNVTINNNPTGIGVDGGDLTFGGATGIVTGAGALTKLGTGTLELAGSTANNYTSNTYVNAGTLRLNKQGPVFAVPAGELMIGDNIGGDNADQVVFAPTAGVDQINNLITRIARSGRLDLNGISETINNTVVLDVGTTYSADFATGAGVFTNNNQFTVVNNAGGNAATAPAVFSGTYDLNGATRNIDVREGGAPTEFDIQGVVQVTGVFGITKIGQGRLRLSGNNTYTGPVAVNFGVLEVGHDNALGTTAGGTTVNNQAALEFNSPTPLTIGELNLTVSGDGWNNSGTGVLNSISPADVTVNSTINVAGSSYLVTSTFGNHSAGTTMTLTSPTTFLGDMIFNGDGDITLNASLISRSIAAPYFSSLQGRLFMATGLGVNADTGGAGQGINNLAPGTAPITAPATTANLNGLLNFPQDSDAAFTTFFGGQPGGAAFTAVYVGMVVIPAPGVYYFAVSNNDDTAAVWVDSSGNNNFEMAERVHTAGCCNATSVGSVNFLSAGTFKIAFAVEDTGGGSGLTGRFQPAAFGIPVNSTNMPIVSTVASGNVIKNDAGIVTFNGQNSFAATTINAGTLVANNAVNALGGGAVTVNATGTLSGVGTIVAPVTANTGGTVDAGPVNGSGVLAVNGNVVLSAGSTFVEQITSAVSFDQLIVTGTVDLTNAILSAPTVGYAPAIGTTFVIISNDLADPVVGTFAGLPEGANFVIGGVNFSISYAAGTNNNDVVLTVLAPTAVYVDDDWTGTPSGAVPATSSPAGLIFGYSAFDTIPAGYAQVDALGTLTVYGGAYPAAVNLNRTLPPIQISTNPNLPLQTTVDVNGVVTVDESTVFQLNGATNLSFGAAVDAGVDVAGETLTVNGANTLTFAAAVGGATPLASLSTDAGGTTAIGANITTDGNQAYGDDVSLTADVTLSTGTIAGDVIFGGTVNASVAGVDLVITAGSGAVTFGGAVGTTAPALNSLVATTTGVVSVNGGAVTTIGSQAYNGGLSIGATTTLTYSGVNGLSTTAPAINLGAFSLIENATTAGSTATLAANISGAGGLTKNGLGTLTLTGANTYGAATAVTAGTLILNGTNTSGVNLSGSAILRGTGSIGGAVSTTGTATVAPGSAAGVAGLVDTGAVTLNTGSTYVVDINGLTPGDGAGFHDQLNVTGAVNLAGATLTVGGSFVVNPAVLQTFIIVANDGADPVVGTFNGLAEGAAIALGAGTVYLSYFGGDGNDVALTSQPVITGTAGADLFVVTPTVTGYDYQLNAGPITSVVGTQAFVFNGLDGDDLMIVNVNNNTAPSITYNGNNQSMPLSTGNNTVHGDVLQLVDQTGTHTATYFGDGVVNASLDNDGTVSILGQGVITFTGLEPVDMIGFLNANVTFANADDVVTIASGLDSATNTLPALIVSGTSGGVPFEAVHLRNNTNVLIDTTTSNGNDTITVNAGAATTHGNVNWSIVTGTGTDTVSFTGGIAVTGTLTVSTVNITDDSNNATTAAAATITLTATGAIGAAGNADIDVNTANLTTTTSGGNQFLRETNGLTDLNLAAGAGNVTLTLVAGSITDTAADGNDIVGTNLVVNMPTGGGIGALANRVEIDGARLTVTYAGASAANDVFLEDTAGGLQLDNSTLSSSGASTTFNLLVTNGSLTSVVDGVRDIGADNIVLAVTGAGSTIGTSAAARLELNAVNQLDATTAGGAADHIWIEDTDNGVSVGLVNAGSGNVLIQTSDSVAGDVRSILEAGADAAADIVGATVSLTVTNASSTIGAAGATLEINAVTLNATTAGGVIVLEDTAGGVAVGVINAVAGSVTLTATGGAITDANGGALNVTAGLLNVTAPNGIDLDTAIAQLTAASTNSAITIRETNGLAVNTVGAGTGNVTLTLAAGAITDNNGVTVNVTAGLLDATGPAGVDLDTDIVQLAAASSNSAITIREASGVAVNAVNAGTGTVTMTATAITDGNGAALNVTAGLLSATAAGGIDLDTAIAQLTAATTNTAIAIRETNGVAVNAVNAGTGNVTLTLAAGAITDNNGVGTLNVTAGLLDATGPGGVDLDTSVTSLTAATTNAALVIREADTVAVNTLTAGTDMVSLGVGGAITDGNGGGVNNVTAGSLLMTAVGGISLDTTVGQLAASNATSGDITITNTGALNITTLSEPSIGSVSGVQNPAGAVTVITLSPLTVSSPVSALGAVVLTASDSAAAGDDLTINATVTSTGSSITLNSGDNTLVTANPSAATTLAINIDAGDLDPNPVTGGATLNIGGAVVLTATGATFTGGGQGDSFTFAPQVSTAINVLGLNPTANPNGDTLTIDTALATNPTLAILAGQGAGIYTFGNRASVQYSSIETATATTPIHISLDATATGIENILLQRSAVPAGTNFEVYEDDVVDTILYAGPIANVLSFLFLGSGNSNTVTIDDVNGLVDLAGTVPAPTGVGNNGNVAGTPEIFLRGNGGTDGIVYANTANNTNQTYGLGTGSGPGSQAGEVLTTNGVNSLSVYFDGMEDVTSNDATPGDAGTLTIVGDANANVMALATSGGGTTMAVTGGYVPFTFAPQSFNAFTVNAGDGNDSIAINSLNPGEAGLAISLNGENNDDTISVGAAPAGSTLLMQGGVGNDAYQLGGAGNLVDNIFIPVTIADPSGTDSLTVNDSSDLTGDTVTITATTIDGINSAPSPNVTFSGVESLDVTTSGGDDVINTTLTGPNNLATVNVRGAGGDDDFFLTVADGLSSPTTLNLIGEAGSDDFGSAMNPMRPVIGPATNVFVYGDTTAITTNPGGAVTDRLYLDMATSGGGTTVQPLVIVDTVGGIATATNTRTFRFGGIDDIDLYNGTELTDVQIGDVYLLGSSASERFVLYRDQAGMMLKYNGMASPLGPFAPAVPNGRMVIYGAAGNDYMEFNFTLGSTVGASFNGGADNDTLIGGLGNDTLAGGAGSDTIRGGEGADRLFGEDAPSTASAVPIATQRATGLVFSASGGNDSVDGGGGNDFVFGGIGDDNLIGGPGDDYVHGGDGNDTLNSMGGNDILRGEAGADLLNGDSGADILLGGAGDDRLFGRGGRDFFLAGAGADQIQDSSDGAEDVTVSGILATDADAGFTLPGSSWSGLNDNDLALQALMFTGPNAWNAPAPFSPNRVGNLTPFTTMTNDNVADIILGGPAGQDYIISNTADMRLNTTGDLLLTL